MRVTQDNLPEIVKDLRQDISSENKRWLREVYAHYGTLMTGIDPDSGLLPEDNYLVPVHTHHTVGRTIRNWMIDYGIDPAIDDGEYLLDEIWCPILEMALGVRSVSMKELEEWVPE